MNKLKLNILSLGLLCFGITGCSESYLDVESTTNVTTENYYKTIDDADRALIGCYDGWQCTTSNGSLSIYVASQVMSDECFGGTGNTDGKGYQAIDRFDISVSSSDANLFNGTWNDYYAGIFRCNTLLQKLDQIDWKGDDQIRKRVEGETRALRAIMYFDLARLFGSVPLLTGPTAENLPQAEPAEIYKLIAEDLKFAADNIPTNAYPKANASTNDGRITCYAAKALLARVYLFTQGTMALLTWLVLLQKSRPWQGWKMLFPAKNMIWCPSSRICGRQLPQHRFRVSLSSYLLTPATETSKPCSP